MTHTQTQPYVYLTFAMNENVKRNMKINIYANKLKNMDLTFNAR